MFSEQIQFAHNQAELWSSNEKFKHIGLRFKTHLAAQGLAEKQPGSLNNLPEQFFKYTIHAKLVWPTFQLCQSTWCERSSVKKMCML